MSQTWNARDYVQHAAFVPSYGHSVFALLNAQPGERILDLGCGDGLLTLDIQNAGASVVGLDASESMIELAVKRGLDARVANGEQLDIEEEFDAVFSNAALHWMKNYQAVISGVRSVLKMGGRFVGEFGGEGNVLAISTAIQQVFLENPEFGKFQNPWFFPHSMMYQQALQENGFRVDYIELMPRPTPLASGVREWLNIFAKGILQHLSETQKEIFLNRVEAILKPQIYVNGVWMADYVRLRFFAVKN